MRTIFITLLTFTSLPLFAQRLPARQPLDEWISTAEEHIVAAADAMPADRYSFAPVNGEFKGVRTFAEQVKHLAANNYAMSARIDGRKPKPEEADESGPADVNDKAGIMAYLKGSFAALHKSVAALDDEQSASVPKGQKHTAAWFAIDAVAHSFNHYGQIVEYLRMNGIIPPASR